jgi:hypothetical protein
VPEKKISPKAAASKKTTSSQKKAPATRVTKKVAKKVARVAHG